MRPKESRPRVPGLRRAAGRIAPLPIEWMDPMSWRLPSGKALAEFALQSGFLAPLMFSGPSLKSRKGAALPESSVTVFGKHREEPDSTGTFRGRR